MEPRDPKTYLWTNIQTLARLPGAKTQTIYANVGGVGKGTFQRIEERQTSVGTDVLAAIARAFGIEVWQLLVPDIDADSLPTLKPSSLRVEADADFLANLLGLVGNLDGPQRAAMLQAAAQIKNGGVAGNVVVLPERRSRPYRPVSSPFRKDEPRRRREDNPDGKEQV